MIKHIFKLIWNKRGSNALILIEIFLAFLVLFAVLSYVIYNVRMLSSPLGFETQDKWMVYLDEFSQKDSLEVLELKNILHSELLSLDKVEAVSYADNVTPYSGNQSRSSGDEMGFTIRALLAFVDSDFAKALGMEVKSGRWFQEDDLTATYPSIVVNQKFIDEYFPGKDMLDSIIHFRGEHKLVGVVDAFKYQGEFEEDTPHVFYQVKRSDPDANNLVLSMSKNTPAAYEETVNKRIADITKSSNFIIKNIHKMKERDSRSTWIPLIAMLCICGFLCINVALGLFGVLWYNINKRKGEIGLRRAIGAHSSDISKQFILEILILTSIAIFLGIFFAIQVPLLKIGPLDPINMYYAILLSTVILILLVTVCALNPSWQASKLHPAAALHED